MSTWHNASVDDTDKDAKLLKQALGPLRLLLGPLVDVAAQVKKQIDAEDGGKEGIMRELRELAAALDRGEIDEDEYDDRETILLDRLEALESSSS
ncbi:MAG: gas vesicle protein GvpG [Deinococcota bacterium]